jgi:formate dehydrogenase major subunit
VQDAASLLLPGKRHGPLPPNTVLHFTAGALTGDRRRGLSLNGAAFAVRPGLERQAGGYQTRKSVATFFIRFVVAGMPKAAIVRQERLSALDASGSLHMSLPPPGLDRRSFLRGAAGGGLGLGGLLGLGFNLQAAQDEVRRFKFAGTKEFPSVCPYCAVGCGQLVSVREGKIVNIEGNPDRPINGGTLCPKGAAAFQLVVNPNRLTKVWHRAPGATEWDKTKSLEWAMDRIARRVKETRDATFQETADKDLKGNPLKDAEGKATTKRVNHTLAIASLGGATLDIEWNYVQAKLMRALGVVVIENQARI